jgi:hypothetical protein
MFGKFLAVLSFVYLTIDFKKVVHLISLYILPHLQIFINKIASKETSQSDCYNARGLVE